MRSDRCRNDGAAVRGRRSHALHGWRPGSLDILRVFPVIARVTEYVASSLKREHVDACLGVTSFCDVLPEPGSLTQKSCVGLT